jgi:propanediol dehydratase small subunit
VAPLKKTTNISTVRATSEEKKKLADIVRDLGFRTIAHFFTRAMETLFEQIESGQELHWPLRFVTKEEQARLQASSKIPTPKPGRRKS